jgi:hypothetical protein
LPEEPDYLVTTAVTSDPWFPVPLTLWPDGDGIMGEQDFVYATTALPIGFFSELNMKELTNVAGDHAGHLPA